MKQAKPGRSICSVRFQLNIDALGLGCWWAKVFPFIIFWQIFTFAVEKYTAEHDCKESLDKMHVV